MFIEADVEIFDRRLFLLQLPTRLEQGPPIILKNRRFYDTDWFHWGFGRSEWIEERGNFPCLFELGNGNGESVFNSLSHIFSLYKKKRMVENEKQEMG